MGRFLGSVHQTGRKQRFQHRPTIDLEEYLHQPCAELASNDLVPAALMQSLDKLGAELLQRWHRDCHPGNILWRDGPLFVDSTMRVTDPRCRISGC
ncbi:serine/threonine protein kinase|nr:serine/threonine protein kinase [Candidatus Pantoea persica]